MARTSPCQGEGRRFESGSPLMEFPPKPQSSYLLNDEQDKRIYDKLGMFAKYDLDEKEEQLINFLYTQLEGDWQSPLEEFIDKLLKQLSK